MGTLTWASISATCLSLVIRLAKALVIWIVGKFIVKKILQIIEKNKKFNEVEGTVKSFVLSIIKAVLYCVIIVGIVGVLGIETSSIVAALASAGVAVGLALQGALSNFAGGIMLVIFKPFKKGDYVDAAGASGVVTDVTMFYTVITTLDNKRITIPNGSLMNANVVDYSSEDLRRVDLSFSCAKSESPDKIQKLILDAIAGNDKILTEPDAPFAKVSGGTNESMDFTVRVWTKNADYWDVYFDIVHNVTVAFGDAGVQAPTVRVANAN